MVDTEEEMFAKFDELEELDPNSLEYVLKYNAYLDANGVGRTALALHKYCAAKNKRVYIRGIWHMTDSTKYGGR